MAVVTISRQFGAGGITLGKMIADKLGYNFVDDEIIRMIAHEAKVSTNWVEAIEKEAGGMLQKFMKRVIPMNMVDRITDSKRGYIDEEIYVDLLTKIVTKIANQDNIVIIGRGGQYILKDMPNAFHLLLVAARDIRIKFMEEHYDLSNAKATQAVMNEYKRRINLYHKFGREDYDSPALYHMVLNMGRIDLDAAQDLVIKLIQG